jgi:hypothetical protein
VNVTATVEFRDLILVDRVDDEDEEFDVHLRLEPTQLVVLDEDEAAMKTVRLSAVTRAAYRTTKPARFSLRRGLRHWLTIESQAGPGPIVLRLNGGDYARVLAALRERGITVEGAP